MENITRVVEMDFKFTFESGSTALAHYGVAGMKWGVWNDETAAKRAHSKSMRYSEKAYAANQKAQALDRTALGRSNSVKMAKYRAKASKYARKANRSDWHPMQSPHRRAVNERKAEKYARKAEGLSGRVSKVEALKAKADKYEFKAANYDRIYKKRLSKISQSSVSKGENAVKTACSS